MGVTNQYKIGWKGMSEENIKVRTPWFRPYSDVRMLLTLLQGVSKSAVKSMAAAIDEQRGTPQNPVDWSDPDTWIVDRLHGNDAQLAQHIWQDSHHAVSPRYIAGAVLLIDQKKVLGAKAKLSVVQGRKKSTQKRRTASS